MKAFLDVQASSNNYKIANIISVSIAVFDDENLIKALKILVKPSEILSPREEIFCGVTNEVLRDQPCLAEHLPEIIEVLEGMEVIFYDKFSEMIWRKSLREIGLRIPKGTILQEMLLQQKLIAVKKDLQALVKDFNMDVTCEGFGKDAQAIAKVYQSLLHGQPFDFPDRSNPVTDSVLSVEGIDSLPDSPGVYYFIGKENEVIYVGKAVRIKERVKSHFASKAPFEYDLCSATFSVEYKETGNELISLLLESADISRLQPKFNTQQLDNISQWTIEARKDGSGIFRLFPIEKNYSDNMHSIAFNRDSVLSKLKNLSLQFSLCHRYAGLERTSGACSSVLCRGVCRGLENKDTYNERSQKAFDSIQAKKESYFIKLKGRASSEEAFVLVRDGIYMGFGFIPMEYPVTSVEDFEAFLERKENTYFTNRSISQYLNKRGIVKYDLD
ncbi:GIY-YIG nuclease family protein [Flavimarina sp. Hel_I_48]|uniref:GIY-YIG nuclease family protein n=1 Tax=Flavimarina sp. Hel_I_48 TaxID=1392488 RepID=UPI00068C0A15|nr:GIY-YIG nuclease family protein [Flavimarina sp. Hel_I_48]